VSRGHHVDSFNDLSDHHHNCVRGHVELFSAPHTLGPLFYVTYVCGGLDGRRLSADSWALRCDKALNEAVFSLGESRVQ